MNFITTELSILRRKIAVKINPNHFYLNITTIFYLGISRAPKKSVMKIKTCFGSNNCVN